MTKEFESELCDIDYSYEEPLKDIFESCNEGNLTRVKQLIEEENVNIYKVVDDYRTPLLAAIYSKKKAVVDVVLDVYERDVEALKDTKYTKALNAMPEDQTDELLRTVKDMPADNSVPVLLKTSNGQEPTLAFFRIKIKNKNDASIRLAHTLEEKYGVCDINCQNEKYFGGPALHFALRENMTIYMNVINSYDESPLELAVFHNNFKAVEIISSEIPMFFPKEGSF